MKRANYFCKRFRKPLLQIAVLHGTRRAMTPSNLHNLYPRIAHEPIKSLPTRLPAVQPGPTSRGPSSVRLPHFALDFSMKDPFR
jgi:hypothetical protein